MRLNKTSIENLKFADRVEIRKANTIEDNGYFVIVYHRLMFSYLQGNLDITFPDKKTAMRTIRRYRKDLQVISI
jgi:hypothetical protein